MVKLGKIIISITGRQAYFLGICCCFSNMPGWLLPFSQAPLHWLECSSFRFPHILPVLVKCHLLKKAYKTIPFKIAAILTPAHSDLSKPPCLILVFFFFFPKHSHILSHHISYLFTMWFIHCLPSH